MKTKEYIFKVLGKLSPRPRKISTHRSPPRKLPPETFPTHFINWLSLHDTSSLNGGGVGGGGGRRDLPPWTKVLISLERLRVIFWKLGNVNKTFSKVSVHDQIVISQYFSEITDQISNKRNNPFLLFKFLTWYKVITYTGNVSCPVSL